LNHGMNKGVTIQV
jgi:hypothetical protein